MTPQIIYLPCGSHACWDAESDMGYRCMDCYAMLGSIGQPRQCQEESDKWKALEALGEKGWDYDKGRQKT